MMSDYFQWVRPVNNIVGTWYEVEASTGSIHIVFFPKRTRVNRSDHSDQILARIQCEPV